LSSETKIKRRLMDRLPIIFLNEPKPVSFTRTVAKETVNIRFEYSSFNFSLRYISAAVGLLHLFEVSATECRGRKKCIKGNSYAHPLENVEDVTRRK
jgi:hypothetical protein